MPFQIKNIIPFIFLCTTISCSAQKDPDAVLKQVFNEQEMVMVNQIIDYYDAFVWSQTDTSLPIDKAYQQFLAKNCTEALMNNTEAAFYPPQKELTAILDAQSKEILPSLFSRDTLFYYSEATGELIDLKPYKYRLQPYDKYVNLLKSLTINSDFYSAYIKGLQGAKGIGGVCGGTYAVIISSYPATNRIYNKYPYIVEFDFNKKEERLTCIIPFLFEYKKIEEPEKGTYTKLYREGTLDW